MSRVLATYNIKGGVGKTSAAVNLATLAARDGHPTLLWDLDPQGASTYLFRVKPKIKGGGAKLVAARPTPTARSRAPTPSGLDLLPADFSYRHMDLALDGDQAADPPRARDQPLERRVRVHRSSTARRASSLVSENVFEAADALLVPIIPATLSSRTLEQLHERAVARRPAGARLLLHGRPPQAAAPRADGASCAREHDVLETRDPGVRRRRAHGGGARRAGRSSRRAAVPPSPTRSSGGRSRLAWPETKPPRGMAAGARAAVWAQRNAKRRGTPLAPAGSGTVTRWTRPSGVRMLFVATVRVPRSTVRFVRQGGMMLRSSHCSEKRSERPRRTCVRSNRSTRRRSQSRPTTMNRLISRSSPAPQSLAPRAPPGSRSSAPSPPISRSRPGPPSIRSAPAPPSRRSSPVAPRKVVGSVEAQDHVVSAAALEPVVAVGADEAIVTLTAGGGLDVHDDVAAVRRLGR